MGIRKRPSKRSKQGFVYEVFFQYQDEYGCSKRFTKCGFINKKEAQEYEVRKKAELIDYSVTGTNNKTFNQVFLEYMEIEGEKYARATKQYYLKSFDLYIKDSIGNCLIKNIKYKDLQKYFNQISKNYSTAKNIKKIFGVTFAFAEKNEYIRENPVKLITLKRPDKEDEEKKTIDRNELNMIIDSILDTSNRSPNYDRTNWNNQVYSMALFIGWFTGLRVSETFGLMKSDIDFDNKTISVNRRLEYHQLGKDELHTTEKLKSKSSKSTIPMAAELIEGLKMWFEKNPYEYVICDIDGRFIHPHSLNARLREVSLKTGIQFHYHMLRHSFASRLVLGGVTPIVAKELVRHADIRTTLNVYTHIEEKDKVEAINSIFN